MSKANISFLMEALASKAHDMLVDPDLKASGLAAATAALKAYAAFRQEQDKRLRNANDEPLLLPRPGVLSGYRENVGNPLGHDGSA